MIAFEIYVNGRKVTTAGVDAFGVISAIVSWGGWDPNKSPKRQKPQMLQLNVAGFNSSADEHLVWTNRALKQGDRIRIEIVEAKKVRKPRSYRESPEMKLRREQEYVRSKAKSWGWKIES